MAKKPTLTTVASGYNSTSQLAASLIALRDGFENTLSLDGSTPNAMTADFDLNNQDLLNGGSIYASTLYLTLLGNQVKPGLHWIPPACLRWAVVTLQGSSAPSTKPQTIRLSLLLTVRTLFLTPLFGLLLLKLALELLEMQHPVTAHVWTSS